MNTFETIKEQHKSTYLILITLHCTFNETPDWNWCSRLLQRSIFNQNELGLLRGLQWEQILIKHQPCVRDFNPYIDAINELNLSAFHFRRGNRFKVFTLQMTRQGGDDPAPRMILILFSPRCLTKKSVDRRCSCHWPSSLAGHTL